MVCCTADMPRCSGVTSVNAGDSTSLVCESTYSGNEQPQLAWYRKVHRRHRMFEDQLPQTDHIYGHVVHSLDEFDIRDSGPVARQVSSYCKKFHQVDTETILITLSVIRPKITYCLSTFIHTDDRYWKSVLVKASDVKPKR